MAFFTVTVSSPARVSIFSKVLSAVIGSFDRIADSQNRSVDVQRLQRLSDRELADIGISRENIVRHVYRDIYYV
jgi:uncharacterized protein YjiS (DUF1127 family)